MWHGNLATGFLEWSKMFLILVNLVLGPFLLCLLYDIDLCWIINLRADVNRSMSVCIEPNPRVRGDCCKCIIVAAIVHTHILLKKSFGSILSVYPGNIFSSLMFSIFLPFRPFFIHKNISFLSGLRKVISNFLVLITNTRQITAGWYSYMGRYIPSCQFNH